MRPTFHTSDDEFQALHEALNKTRSTSSTLRVPRDAIAHILMDHARLAQLLEERAA